MKRFVLLAAGALCNVAALMPSASGELLLRQPAVSSEQIAFVYAGDLWAVPREGGEARRLTAGSGEVGHPTFSPDGSLIAFSAHVDGNTDVYLMPAGGGVVRRVTYHPGGDIVRGWTPDGKRILFESSRNTYRDAPHLYTVALQQEGFPSQLPLPVATEGSYSSDAARIAYVPVFQWQEAWKRYRGGQTRHIWLAGLSDLAIEPIPRDNSNDFNPMWVGGTVYFLSDRNGPVSLFSYDTQAKQVKEVVRNTGLDINSASAGPGAIVYERFGEIHLFDLASGQPHRVPIVVNGDLPATRPHYAPVSPKRFVNVGISPAGARAVFESHGEILTVPAEKGDIRNLTNSPGAAERDPSWSPDGRSIACFSDASGEYQLEIRNPNGMGDARTIGLGSPPSFFYSPTWSPDSKKIAYTDKRGNLWYVDAEKGGAPKRVDTDRFADQGLSPAWAPDSKWISYVKTERNFRKVLWLYSLAEGKAFSVTDGMSDAQMPVFDVNGKYLYFTASTDVGLSSGNGDMTALGHPVTRNAYVVVLDKSLPSPLPHENDDEKADVGKKDGDEDAKPEDGGKKNGKGKDGDEKPVVVKIDIDGIGQRILALPIPGHNYLGMWRGKEGILFLTEGPEVMPVVGDEPPPFTVQRFDLSKRKVEKVVDGVSRFAPSFDGEKLLFCQGDGWTIADAGGEIEPGKGALNLDGMNVFVDPRAEWKQMYHEAWRIQRDFFYDPGFHGLDLAAAEKRYETWVEGLSCRADLTRLFVEMLGNITVGHMYVWGPPDEDESFVRGGLLGADYSIENGRYRFARVYSGENWNPQMHAPLTQPGVNVAAGEYLLAVNGRDLGASDNLYSLFQATAGKAVTIEVGPNPDGKGAREVQVVPVADETALRNLAWIEANRRKVDELSGGRVGYVWVPDTGGGGFVSFNRYYFAQTGKEGVVIDDRFNHGGYLADYIVDYMNRRILSGATNREGEDTTNPSEGIFGPKVMIVNEFAGSGGDALPWYFRKLGLGTIVGKRTWGGLVGIGGYPELLDGGGVTSPRWGLYGVNGEWEVENHGIQPDVEVELEPKASAEGHDLQLERAVKLVMDELENHPLPKYQRPPYPDYHQTMTVPAE